MGLLTAASQVFYGTKTFANDVVIKGKLRLEGEITRTNRAYFKLDKSVATTDLGTLKIIPEASRPATWVLNGGTATSYTDVNFGAYRPKGAKALLLHWALSWGGNGAQDNAQVLLRKNGSAIDSDIMLVRCEDFYEDLASGTVRLITGRDIVECDENGVVEYKWPAAYAPSVRAFYLTIFGYYL